MRSRRIPTTFDSAVWLGIAYVFAGHTTAARGAFSALLRRDPLSPFPSGLTSAIEWMEGNFAGALSWATRCVELAPDSTIWRWHLGYAKILAGRLPEARAEAELMMRSEPGHPYSGQLLALTRALVGDLAGAHEAWAPFAGATFDHHLTFHIGEQYAVLGDAGRAVELLENAIARGFHPYGYMANHAPLLDGLRGDPRFAGVLDRAKQRWEAFRP